MDIFEFFQYIWASTSFPHSWSPWCFLLKAWPWSCCSFCAPQRHQGPWRGGLRLDLHRRSFITTCMAKGSAELCLKNRSMMSVSRVWTKENKNTAPQRFPLSQFGQFNGCSHFEILSSPQFFLLQIPFVLQNDYDSRWEFITLNCPHLEKSKFSKLIFLPQNILWWYLLVWEIQKLENRYKKQQCVPK